MQTGWNQRESKKQVSCVQDRLSTEGGGILSGYGEREDGEEDLGWLMVGGSLTPPHD